ncbi:hypothetical protein AMS68_006701 [Peltaster fructicola]|uniref:Metallo-dependent hydrolase n=1 Tax=Peltaster fructicola TaxID=286661 RepID=A0A6H0Y2E4_9PEZI|nr:hypothetical protein AMS68_006701 [Peltaster fructicola]
MTDFPWKIGVFDAHCHPTDTVASLRSVPGMRARVLTIMATRSQDQSLVAKAADDFSVTSAELQDANTDWSSQHRIIPAFGWHPWFSYQMFFPADHGHATVLAAEQKTAHYLSVLTPRPDDAVLHQLPDPSSFDEFMQQTETYLNRYPLALIGEVGLDKAFRIPEHWLPQHLNARDDSLTPGGREGRKLSPYRVSMEHQKKILKAQLNLAGRLGRAASVHGVQAHGIVYETLAETWKGHERQVISKRDRKKATLTGLHDGGLADDDDQDSTEHISKTFPPRICLHSFSGQAETVKQYLAPSIPCEIFFSFSVTINAWAEQGEGKVETAVKAVPDSQILIESDLHTAGDRMDNYLEQAARKICEVKGWSLQSGVQQLADNWKRFVTGS